MMKTKRIPYFLFTVSILCFFSTAGFSQKRQLVASDKVKKIGFIDHSQLRKQYKAYYIAKEKIAKENRADQELIKKSLEDLDRETQQKLRKDSTNGNKNKDEIRKGSTGKRMQLLNDHQAKQKRRNEERLALMQNYEQKIRMAIDAVVSEGGFTDVMPPQKDADRNNGIDITDMILKKLN